MALSLIFLMMMFARLYRKAGPHEALIVYGFRGTRIIKGHGTVIFPMIENCKRPLTRIDVIRRGAAAGSLYQSGRGRDRRSRGADQGQIRSRIDPNGRRTVSHQETRRNAKD